MNTKQRIDAIREKALELMTEHHVPGISIGLIVDGTEHYIPLGVTSIDNPLEVTPDTLFQIASVTKTFTASIAMKLVELGKLELDATVRTYIPSFKLQDESVAARVTVRHLLTHTSGFMGDFDIDTGDGKDALERFVEHLVDFPQLVPLDSLAQYSNSAFCLLGRLIEIASGKTLDVTARELLLEPLGLHDTVYWAHEAIVKRTSVGHKQSEEEQTVVIQKWRMPRLDQADGSLSSTARDLMKYARFHMGQLGDDLLSSATRAAMQKPGPAFSSTDSVGLCWFVSRYEETNVIGHGGDVDGFHAQLSLVPAHNFAVSIQTNSDGGGQARTDLLKFALETFLGLKKPEPQAIPTTAQQLEEFVAWYVLPTGNPEDGIEISLEQDVLHVRVNVPSFSMILPAMAMNKIAPDVFTPTDGPMAGTEIEFVRSEARVKFLRAAGRISIRQDQP